MFEETVATKKLSELFEKHVPRSGPAPTEGGEIVRAITRIGYRWYNDGDMLGHGYGNETCNPAGRFLMAKCGGDISKTVAAMWRCELDRLYDVGVAVLEELVLNFLEDNPGLFERENKDDIWNYKELGDREYEEYSEEREET